MGHFKLENYRLARFYTILMVLILVGFFIDVAGILTGDTNTGQILAWVVCGFGGLTALILFVAIGWDKLLRNRRHIEVVAALTTAGLAILAVLSDNVVCQVGLSFMATGQVITIIFLELPDGSAAARAINPPQHNNDRVALASFIQLQSAAGDLQSPQDSADDIVLKDAAATKSTTQIKSQPALSSPPPSSASNNENIRDTSRRARAKADMDASYVGKPNFLQFKRGDVVFVVNSERQWWEAKSSDLKQHGWIPSNFFDLL